MQAHSSMAEAADVELACLQRRRPLWQARDWRRRERLARPLNATTTGFGEVNIADARSLAPAWRGSSRQTVMFGPRGMACWGRALGTRYVLGGAVCGLLPL